MYPLSHTLQNGYLPYTSSFVSDIPRSCKWQCICCNLNLFHRTEWIFLGQKGRQRFSLSTDEEFLIMKLIKILCLCVYMTHVTTYVHGQLHIFTLPSPLRLRVLYLHDLISSSQSCEKGRGYWYYIHFAKLKKKKIQRVYVLFRVTASESRSLKFSSRVSLQIQGSLAYSI